ncbi:LPXTG cell wall anchor domain-containing protein, partial [uncultured Bifidobacterium sp.]|uniref:LPXTG cell wall anchor domain-containing protein n=1 Tax=uncultured Bifidobacterium sp. TaxID=165187 RepID=UPI0025999081
VNGADVVLSAGSAASFSAGIGARSHDGAVWMLVEKSDLTSRSLSAASSIDAARNQSFGIMAEANTRSETPRIQIFNSKIEASGATAGIYAINRNVANATLFRAAMIDLRGNATITTPTDGAVRDVKKVVDTGQWPSSQNGQVVGVAGSSAITDIVGSSEVAHDVVIDFGDGQEPEPMPEPDPTPNPDPVPNPEQKPDLKPADKDAKTTTTVATKTATGAKNASGVLAATGDNAATAAAALGIAGASVIGAGFVASKRRDR